MMDVSGSRTLHRLIYASRAQIDRSGLDQAVEQIIAVSVRNNRKVGVTGLLLVHEGWFVQALEGAAEAVMTTYGRILRDPRHLEPTVLAAGPVDDRAFADWNMCARRLSAADDAILETLSQRNPFEPTKLSATAALRLLTAVRGIQRRTEVIHTI
jgi:blue light- and temperature-responsive anti-repressor